MNAFIFSFVSSMRLDVNSLWRTKIASFSVTESTTQRRGVEYQRQAWENSYFIPYTSFKFFLRTECNL